MDFLAPLLSSGRNGKQGDYRYCELEIVNAYQGRRQFKLAVAGIAYNGEAGAKLRAETGLTPDDVRLYEDWVTFRARGVAAVMAVLTSVMEMCKHTGFAVRMETVKMCVAESAVEYFFRGKTAAQIRGEFGAEADELERQQRNTPQEKRRNWLQTRRNTEGRT